MKISPYISGAVSRFSYWFAHGTLGYPLLEGVPYVGEILLEESSFAEQAFAVFMNNLEVDQDGAVTNYKYCEQRAAQYIRRYFDRTYEVTPPFLDWELELHSFQRER